MTKRVIMNPDPNLSLQVPDDLVYSDSEKAETLAGNIESQLQPVPLSPMQMDKVERIRDVMETLALAPAREPLLTNLTEVSKAMAELKVGKAPGPNGVPNRALRNLPRKAVTFLTKVFNGVQVATLPSSMETRPRDFPAQTG